MNGYERRIQTLEALLVETEPAQTPEEAERERRYVELSAELSRTMSTEHIVRINAAVDVDNAGQPPVDAGAARLAAVVWELLDAAVSGLGNFKLALPEAVARVYLNETGHHPFSQCRDCGLVLPLGLEFWVGGGEHHPERNPFERCPDCGGGIGRWDKWDGGATLPTPEEKRAAFRAMTS